GPCTSSCASARDRSGAGFVPTGYSARLRRAGRITIRSRCSHDPVRVMVILETERLTLRHLEPADLEPLFALYRDPEIRRYFPDGTLTLDETRQEIEWFRNGHPSHPVLGLWATIERRTGAFVGRCGLLPWSIDGRDEVELAFLIDKTRWGHGLATEAARAIVGYAREQLGLTRLICLITPGNDGSVRVASKVGMTFEREHTDEYGLCHIYSRSLIETSDARRPVAPDS
ncbi:MAG TPA: GNAT family N-acetyltransferase, partial [Candidatus Eisenbacteria bacterium]|nr:GNAT family N-acetyltransferase [Candidatus Eisenbacteria bacterium]